MYLRSSLERILLAFHSERGCFLEATTLRKVLRSFPGVRDVSRTALLPFTHVFFHS